MIDLNKYTPDSYKLEFERINPEQSLLSHLKVSLNDVYLGNIEYDKRCDKYVFSSRYGRIAASFSGYTLGTVKTHIDSDIAVFVSSIKIAFCPNTEEAKKAKENEESNDSVFKMESDF